MANVKAGDLAYIVRPWVKPDDIGRPVTVVRAGSIGEVVSTRGGILSHVLHHRLSWLCEANGDRFPKFIADKCLRRLGGDLTGDTEPTSTTLPERAEV